MYKLLGRFWHILDRNPVAIASPLFPNTQFNKLKIFLSGKLAPWFGVEGAAAIHIHLAEVEVGGF